MIDPDELRRRAIRWLHGQGCAAPPPGHYPDGWEVCTRREYFERSADWLLRDLGLVADPQATVREAGYAQFVDDE